MGIDFGRFASKVGKVLEKGYKVAGRPARNITIGYLGAKIANTEANDEMNANIAERAGLNFYENTLPDFQDKEKIRKETFSKIRARYNPEIAEYMDQNNFITGDPNDYDTIVEMLGANNNYNETQLKSYLELVDAGTYTERAGKRISSIQEKEKTIKGLTSGSSKIGNMTADLLINGGPVTTDADIVTPKTVTTPETQIGPIITPEKTEPVDLPSFEKIFGDTAEADNIYLDMDSAKQKRYKDLALKVFAMDKESLTGEYAVAQGYEEDYKEGIDDGTISNKTTRNQYIFNRWFAEQFLPGEGVSYRETMSESFDQNHPVTKARMAINYNKSIGNDAGADEAREILKSLGYEPSDYGL